MKKCATIVPLKKAPQVNSVGLWRSESAELVDAYIKAFNSGNEETFRSFLSSNVSEDGVKRRSIDERLQIYREMHARIKSLELNRVLAASPSQITCLFRTGAGEWIEIGFEFEAKSPHKLIGLRVEDADPPSAGEPASPNQVGPPAKMTEAEVLQAVEKSLNELVAADKFSGTVLIAKHGKVMFQKAYGLASKEYNVPNRIDTKFNLGSINKIFTQIAIGQLVEQGKIAFDDKLSKHLSDYPNCEVAEKVAIRQLLTMTSGIGDIFGEKFDLLSKDKLRSLKDFIPLFANEPLAFEPGSKQQYSNGGYVVLGAIIEKLSGQSYHDYVREHIFKVAGMENTDAYEQDTIVPNRASGYTTESSPNGLRRNNIYFLPARGSSAGGGYSTADDLLKFAVSVEKGKIRIPNFRNPERAAGVQSRGDEGIGIAGGAPGTNALLEFNPESGFAVIVLSNYDPPRATAVGKQIRQWLSSIKP